MTNIATNALLQDLLAPRLTDEAKHFMQEAIAEIRSGASPQRLAQLLALASRHVKTGDALAPDNDELEAANQTVDGWKPACWSVLETLRIALLLTHPEIEGEGFGNAYESAFRYADHGELCALYRALPLLPKGERFFWRAAEGCRSNMRSVFEAVATDSPYAASHFDDIAWRQLVIKALFLDIPLWRIHGLDQRLSAELARMALDLAEERRSAGRPVSPQLWLCLGRHAGERGLQALKQELNNGTPQGQHAALLALARADALTCAQSWLGSAWAQHMPIMAQVSKGDFSQSAFSRL